MIYRIKKGLCILAAAGMLLTCILISVTNVFGATEDGVKTVTVAYFYDRSYFGEKYLVRFFFDLVIFSRI